MIGSGSIVNGINEKNIDSIIVELDNAQTNIRKIFADISKIVEETKLSLVSDEGDIFRNKCLLLDTNSNSIYNNINTIKKDLANLKENYNNRNIAAKEKLIN